MLKNIYAPLSGAIAQEKVLDILANNMANTNTTGFKEEQVSFRQLAANPWPNYKSELPPAPFKQNMDEIYPLHGNEMEYAALANVKTDFTQGTVGKTENPLDLALQGKGFFSVQTPFGTRFTRDGSFTITTDGTLVTKNGFLVEGEKGAIGGIKEGEIKILDTGEVYNGDKFIDKVKIVEFDDPSLLEKLGGNLYIHDGSPANAKASDSRVLQGYLESSNVNPMQNLTNMIIAHRTYEAMQKAIKSHDETMQLAASKIGEL